MSVDAELGETPEPNDSRLPLAWGLQGDPIAVPEDAAGWRVRRLKIGSAGGAPELVYENGRPLILPIDATAEELIERVNGRAGRYRLDAVDETGRAAKCSAAYAVVEREPTPAPQAHEPASDRMCPNCKTLMQSVLQLAGDMRQIATTAVTQSAPMITAASGVIVPEKRRVEIVEQLQQAAPGFDWGAFLAGAAPMLQQALALFTKANTAQSGTASSS